MSHFDAERPPGAVASLLDRTPVWIVWLFVFLLATSFIYSQVSVSAVDARNRDARVLIRDAQVSACERLNTLRESHNANNATLRQVLTMMAASNLDDDPTLARELTALAASFTDVPLTDCEQAYPEAIETAGV